MRVEGSGKRIKDDPAPYIQLSVLSLAIATGRGAHRPPEV